MKCSKKTKKEYDEYKELIEGIGHG